MSTKKTETEKEGVKSASAKKPAASKPPAKKSAGESAEKKSFKETMEPFLEKVQENFIGANYIAVLKRWNVLKGRANRKEFWLFALVNFCIGIVLAILGAIPILGLLFRFISFLFNLAVFLPNFTVGVRRLHDTNRSGWTLLLLLIPLVGFIILISSLIVGMGDLEFGLGFRYWLDFGYGWLILVLIILSFLLILAGVIPILVFLIMAGTPGENKYGPVPEDA
jgi:uncharacterized membrane protein YhaH (DUF805 family)